MDIEGRAATVEDSKVSKGIGISVAERSGGAIYIITNKLLTVKWLWS